MHVPYGQNADGLPHYTAEPANAVSEHADVTVLEPTETNADDVVEPSVDVREAFAPLGSSRPKLSRRQEDPGEIARGILSYRNLHRIRRLDVVHDASGLFPQVKFFLKQYDIDARRPLVVTPHDGHCHLVREAGRRLTCRGFPVTRRGLGHRSRRSTGDPDALARAVTSVLWDDDSRREVAASSRRLAGERSWDSIADRHLDLYNDVTGTRR